MPLFGGRNFWQDELSDFITRSLSSVYITTWLISLFPVQPLVTTVSALIECVCHTGEQFSVNVAVIISKVLFLQKSYGPVM